uniref:Ionotropic glutamate receptor L-glutamate and glycine-binding domain-containing protein n=1 Tax=Anopheles epiroticus TaxID=199890 RepID=A0A182PFM9_9DIPT
MLVVESSHLITNTQENLLEQLAVMLLRRGLLNYCLLHTHTITNQLALTTHDTIANRFHSYDANTPFEQLFPPVLRTLAGYKLHVLLSDNYPYAYLLSGVWEGMDAYILTLAKDRFKCEIELVNMAITRHNALHRMELIRAQLENGSIDIHMPRAHVSSAYVTVGVAPAYEWESLVLVVPKSDLPNLTNIMLQPFSIEVWTMVLCYLLAKQTIKLITFLGHHCKRFRPTKTFRCNWTFGSFGSLSTVAVELVSFLLIEAYLAKITEFLLYCRFRPDPQTLAEFFRSDIRVLIPEYMDPLVDTLGTEVATNFAAKTVRPDEYARMPATCCARIHTLPRAEYVVRMGKYFDATLGRKQLYILPEHLKIIPMSYLLGRHFAFKRSFQLFLVHVYEGGLVAQYVHSHLNEMALMERNFFTKGWLTLGDLLPLFVLIAAGWCCSLVAFLVEVFGVQFKRYWTRNRVQPVVAESS